MIMDQILLHSLSYFLLSDVETEIANYRITSKNFKPG